MTPLVREKKAIDTPVAQENRQQAGGATLSPPGFNLQASPAAAPVQKQDPPGVKKGGGTHTVVKGDTLWELSRKIYGHQRYMKDIKAANPGKNMVIGEVYTIPEVNIPIGTAIDDRKENQAALRDLVVAIPQADYDDFRRNQNDVEAMRNAELMQLVEMVRSTGMTIDEMGSEQKTFMESQAKAEGKTVGEFIHEKVKTQGYGGANSDKWDALKPSEQADYAKRFRAVVKRLETEAPDGIKEIIRDSKKKGGGFIWEPADVEKNGAFAYTNDDWSLHAGVKFVDAVEQDLDAAYPSIAHEMAGHNEYGHNERGFSIFNNALSKLSKEDQKKATEGKNSTYSTFGYMETEIWAELREEEFDNDHNNTDKPFKESIKRGKTVPADVKRQLERIKETFAPKIAEALVKSLYLRAKEDPRIKASAFFQFRADIKTVFGLSL